MREIEPDNCIKYMALVRRSVSSDWLSKELEKIGSYTPPKKLSKLSFIDYTEKFHPLAFLIYQTDKQLKSCAEKRLFEVSEAILRLSYLGENLFILKEQKVQGMDNKIQDLISSDKELFDKTVYEIEVAAAYTRKNCSVEFIETRSKEGAKTPDLLINKEVEIECKKKDRISSRDMRNTEYWKLILRKASGMMEHFGLNYAVFIKTQRDLQEGDAEFILQQLRKLIIERKQGNFAFRDKGIGISLQIISAKNEEIESKGIEFGTSEELDYVVPAMEFKVDDGGKAFIRNPRIFGFKSAELPDRITSVVKSVKDATQQLSGERPGLIYVNLNMIDRKMIDKDFEKLDRLIKELLKNNSVVSGVTITSEFFERDAQGYVYSHRARVIRNEQAKYPLPSNFEIVGETRD
jgi:hypothetical protein